VVSGVDEGTVYYIKRYVHKEITSGIHVTYPVALKGKYDPLTAAIVRTFKPSK
jgi:hypothetical protein